MKGNRRHFHIWHLAKGGRAMFRQARAFNTHQSARKFAKRRGEDPAQFMVKECWDPRCKVPIDT